MCTQHAQVFYFSRAARTELLSPRAREVRAGVSRGTRSERPQEAAGPAVRSFCFCLMSSDAKSILGTIMGGGGGPAVTLDGVLYRPVPLNDTDARGHTPSIAFRHVPPKEGCRKPVLGVGLRASLSGTFLPALVTPLNGHSFYLRAAVHRGGRRPPKGLGSNKTVEAT